MSQENVDLVKAILRAAQADWEWVSYPDRAEALEAVGLSE